jgi:BirA family biotin operon repressor/biotin-[acetyl-CoA-carboxylase] ligase
VTRDEIARRLDTIAIGRSLDLRATTRSTNDDARVAAEGGAPHGHVVLADSQTAGRGSHGRTWSSPPGLDLYFSIVDRRPVAPAIAPLTTLAIGLAVAEVVERACERQAQVKWPNDVLVGDRKCAGILVETTTKGAEPGPRILGIGVNVNRRAFEPGYEATSIALERGREIDRVEIFAGLCGAIEAWLDRHAREGNTVIAGTVRERLALAGRRVRVNDEHGIVRGVDDGGALLLETDAGERRIVSGRIERDQ